MTDAQPDPSQEKLESLDGLKTAYFCKVFEVAGHQLLVEYEFTMLKLKQRASICVPGLGRIYFDSVRDCDSYADAQRFLDGFDHMKARQTIQWLGKRAKKIQDAMRDGRQ